MSHWKLDKTSSRNSITISRVPNGWGMDLKRVEKSDEKGMIYRLVEEHSVDENLAEQLRKALAFFSD